MDVVAFLLFEELNTATVGWDSPDRDVYFSSKGHDVPGLYAALYALGVIPRERLARLRRLGGLDGHPDVGVPGIEANSGSLGMGDLEGARDRLGEAAPRARRPGRRHGRRRRAAGGPELRGAAGRRARGAFGPHGRRRPERAAVGQADGRDRRRSASSRSASARSAGTSCRATATPSRSCARAFAAFRDVGDRPQALVARTIKGKGVSFMEHPEALRAGGGTYRWHAGAPDDEAFARAFAEIARRLEEGLRALGLGPLRLEPLAAELEPSTESLEGEPESGAGTRGPRVTDEYVVDAYGEELVRLGAEREDLVVLDADLASDCRVRAFELAYPERFVECGIAEQDMVSTAAGLARHGLLPVVNSFASFLASRANEQIYNQASERTKVIYALHYAGLIPAGPGKSHQSVRDISLLAALPELDDRAAGEPGGDARPAALGGRGRRRASRSGSRSGPSPRRIELDGPLAIGSGRTLREGADAVLLAYGPVMLHEALLAAELLGERGIELEVVNMPWLNRFDAEWLDALAASASSCSRTTRRSAASATRCDGRSDATSPCSASRAGPRAARRPRRSVRTGSTATRSRRGSRD